MTTEQTEINANDFFVGQFVFHEGYKDIVYILDFPILDLNSIIVYIPTTECSELAPIKELSMLKTSYRFGEVVRRKKTQVKDTNSYIITECKKDGGDFYYKLAHKVTINTSEHHSQDDVPPFSISKWNDSDWTWMWIAENELENEYNNQVISFVNNKFFRCSFETKDMFKKITREVANNPFDYDRDLVSPKDEEEAITLELQTKESVTKNRMNLRGEIINDLSKKNKSLKKELAEKRKINEASHHFSEYCRLSTEVLEQRYKDLKKGFIRQKSTILKMKERVSQLTKENADLVKRNGELLKDTGGF